MLQRRPSTMEIPASTKILARFSRRLTQLSCNSATPQDLLEIQTTRVRHAKSNSDFVSSSKIGRARRILSAPSSEGALDFFEATSPFHLRTSEWPALLAELMIVSDEL